MKSYAAYKDSGIEWIGKVPSHWDVKKLKYISTINPSRSVNIMEDQTVCVYSNGCYA